MSYTGCFTEFVNSTSNKPPLILEYEKLKSYLKKEGAFQHAIITESTENDDDSYPMKRTIYYALNGFKMYKDTDCCNLERMAVNYDLGSFVDFFGEISEYTQSFCFCCSDRPSHFPTLADIAGEDEQARLFEVVCENGTVDVKSLTVKFERCNIND